MRAVIAALMLLALALVALPGTATASTPPWPSVADVRAATPQLTAEQATCMAAYYEGRLSRKEWRTPYFELTSEQKIVTDSGLTSCLDHDARTELLARQDTAYFGKHPVELRCSSRKMMARSSELLLSLTTLERTIRENDKVYRSCRLIGELYASLGKSTKLKLTPVEKACANEHGSAGPLRNRGKNATRAQRKAIGSVLDRCVGRKSKLAMWRRLLADFRPVKAVDCIAKRSVDITFVTFFSKGTSLQREAGKATTSCLLKPAG